MRVAFLIFGFMVPFFSIIQFAFYFVQMAENFDLEHFLPFFLSFLLSILIAAVVSMLCFYAASEIKKAEQEALETFE